MSRSSENCANLDRSSMTTMQKPGSRCRRARASLDERGRSRRGGLQRGAAGAERSDAR